MELHALLAATLPEILERGWNILLVALGLGFVIFVHELGHFAVAKWVGVYVERFSIGFGPKIWAFRRGETEYALSALPFGGYVKMLGENPDEDKSDDPRAYSNQAVPKRMAIISAGVIMNIIFGFIFFLMIFNLGVPYTPPVVGAVHPGRPAWQAGLERGDRILAINGQEVVEFDNVVQDVILSNPEGDGLRMTIFRRDPANILAEFSGSYAGQLNKGILPDEIRKELETKSIEPKNGTVTVEDPNSIWVVEDSNGGLTALTERDGSYQLYSTLELSVYPELKRLAPDIGISGPSELRLPSGSRFVGESTAAEASGGFKPGDRIIGVDGEEVYSYPEFRAYVGRHAEKTIEVKVRRAEKDGNPGPVESFRVEPQRFRDLGIRFEIPEITAVLTGSPADRATEDGEHKALRKGDKIATVNGVSVDPLRLPNTIADLAKSGEPITLKVIRQEQGNEELNVTVEPWDLPAWENPPARPGDPLTVPSLGICYKVFHRIVQEPKPYAAAVNLENGDLITQVKIILGDKEQKFTEMEDESDKDRTYLPFIFWMLQQNPDSKVQFTVKRGEVEIETAAFSPPFADDWYAPFRGIPLLAEIKQLPAQGFVRSLDLGYRTTKGTLARIYLTLRRLMARTVSPQLLSGPIGIAQFAYNAADGGIMKLVKFLALLSINLAVINFLPIPILDGGHMVFLIWEWIRGKPASERVMIAANYVGLMLIISLALWVTTQDILRMTPA